MSSKFIKDTQPINILDVIPEKVLCRLLASYCFPLETALSVCYAKRLPADEENLDWVRDEEAENRFFRKICWEYRHFDKKCNKACAAFDNSIALKYFEGKWTGSKLYHCRLGLWDMVYPLCIEGCVMGVLFSGQIVIGKDVDDWCEELNTIKNEVIWDVSDEDCLIPKKQNQLQQVYEIIDAQESLKPEQKKVLKQMFSNEIQVKDIDVKTLLGQYEKFKEFGVTLESLLREMHDDQNEAARSRHIHDASKQIGIRGDRLTEEPERFWGAIDEIVKNTLPKVKGYVFYKLDHYGKNYELARQSIFDKRLILNEEKFEELCWSVFDDSCECKKKKEFFLYDFITRDNLEKFQELLNDSIIDWEQLINKMSLISIPLIEGGQKITGGFISFCLRDEDLLGTKEQKSKDLLGFYIEALSDIADVVKIVLARHIRDEALLKSIGRLTHELKVPLVATRGAVDLIQHSVDLKQYLKYDYIGDIWSWSTLMGRLVDNADIFRYSEEEFLINPTKTRILADVIAPSVKESSFLLRERRFSYDKIHYDNDIFRQFPRLWLDRNRFQQVIFNLLLNAFKYAYEEPESFAIDINGAKSSSGFTIWFRDWGTGIEDGMEEKIFEKEFRGENAVKVNVTGQGLGLWIVRRIIERHGGTIKVTNFKGPTEFKILLPKSLIFQKPS